MGGPFTNGEVLVEYLRKQKNEKVKNAVVRTELQYVWRIGPHRFTEDPDLFKLNSISYDLQLSNLLTILEDAADLDSSGVPVLITLPTAGDILDMMPTAPVTVWWEQRHSSYQCMGGEQGNELVSRSR